MTAKEDFEQAVVELRERIGDQTIAMVCTRAPDGSLHARPLEVAEVDDAGSLWFVVDGDADWVAGLRPHEALNCSVSAKNSWVSIAGRASIHRDPAKAHRLWSEQVALPGPGDDRVRLLEVAADSVEYWDSPSGVIGRMVGLAKRAVGANDTVTGQIEL